MNISANPTDQSGEHDVCDPGSTDPDVAVTSGPVRPLIPDGEGRTVASEWDVAAYELAADQAMVAANDAITATAEQLSQQAVAAQLARVAADKQQADAIADCAVQTAAAVEMSNNAAALRTAWDASQKAEDLAAHVLPGDEAAAAAAARHTAIQVAMAAAAREEEAASAADQASKDAAYAAADLADAAHAVARAATMTVHSQESALGGIRFNTAVQVAQHEVEAPPAE